MHYLTSLDKCPLARDDYVLLLLEVRVRGPKPFLVMRCKMSNSDPMLLALLLLFLWVFLAVECFSLFRSHICVLGGKIERNYET